MPESIEVHLRALATSDVDALVACCQDPDIVRHTRVPHPYGPAEAAAFVADGEDDARGGFVRAVTAGDDRLVGTVAVSVDPEQNGEIGFWVAPSARRRGVAARAVHLACRRAFGDVGLAVLIAHVSVTNPRSSQLLRGLGFRPAGRLRAAHVDGPSSLGTPRVDVDVLDLLPSELTALDARTR